MKKDKNKVEKIDEKEAENVSGGYYGKDWNKHSDLAYAILNIVHKKNKFKKDKYFYNGVEIPGWYADQQVTSYLENQDEESALNNLEWTTQQIKSGKGKFIGKVWHEW